MNSSFTIRLPGLAIPTKDSQTSAAPVAGPVADSALSDEALMAQIWEGSREALGVLFSRYARLVRGVALRVLRDPSEADDLLQDIFLGLEGRSYVQVLGELDLGQRLYDGSEQLEVLLRRSEDVDFEGAVGRPSRVSHPRP